MQDAHDFCVVNRDEDTVRARPPAVRQYLHRMFRIDALWRDKTPFRMLESDSARRVLSAPYAMLATQPVEHLPSRLGAPGFHVCKSLLNAFDGFDAAE